MSAKSEPRITNHELRETDVRELKPGVSIEREIQRGEVHTYQVKLQAGQFLRAIVEQRGIDVIVKLFAPNGNQIVEMDAPNDMYGPKPVSAIAELPGNYRLEVHPVTETLPRGRYEVKIHELREARPQDNERIEAERAIAEGTNLKLQETARAMQDAVKKYQVGLRLFRIMGDRYWEAIILQGISSVYFSLGESQKAFDCLDQLLRIDQAIENGNRRAYTLWAMGAVYKHLAEYEKALKYTTQSISLLRTMDDRFVEAVALSNLGATYRELGEYEKALEHLNQALLLERLIGDKEGEARTLAGIGRTYALLGKKKQALETFRQSLALSQEAKDHSGIARRLTDMGKAYASMGSHQRALEYYDQALRSTRSVGDRHHEAAALYGIARVKRDRDNLIDARARIEEALRVVESLRTDVASQQLRATFLASKREYYEFYIDLLMRSHQRRPLEGYDAGALQISERARARSLLDSLTEASSDIRQGVDPALLEQERMLQQQVKAKERDRLQLLRSKQDQEQAATVEKELSDLLTKYEEIQARIRANSPHYVALTQPQPLSLKQIQQHVLDENTLLLEYAVGQEQSYLWAVTPTSINSFKLPNRSEIETAALRVYDLLTARNKPVSFETREEKQARVTQADSEYQQAATILSRMVLEPVAEHLGKKRLLVVSEGALQYVPFGALPKPVDRVSGVGRRASSRKSRVASQQPLVVDHEIVSLPSASVIAVLRQEPSRRKPAAKAVAVLADPVFEQADPRVQSSRTRAGNEAGESLKSFESHGLTSDLRRSISDVGLTRTGLCVPRLPSTRKEAEAILSLTPKDQSLIALDFEAGRELATSADLGQYRIVHFATHGLLNSKHPELSGIVLTLVDERGRPKDGFLLAHEIYNLKLPADLVVLSGCKTGLGKKVKGEGLVGMTRGFMYAGAARVMVSLWDINDAATAELMKRFYQAMLVERERPAAALRMAQVSMWKEKQWRAPYYWAAFVLQGEWR